MSSEASAFLNEPLEVDAPTEGSNAKAFLNAPVEEGDDLDASAFLNAPTASPITGFVPNLRNPIDLMKEESLPANIGKWIAGDQEVAEPLLISLSGALSQMERDGLQDTTDYRDLEQYYDGMSAVINSDDNDFSFSGLWGALKEDTGGVMAEFANALMADPYLALTPLGWERAAALATTRAGKVAAGLSGAAATGAAVEAPISIFQQLADSGEINGEKFATDLSVAALASAAVGGLYTAVSSAARSFAKAEKPLLGPLDMGHINAGAAAVDDVAPDGTRIPNVLVQSAEVAKDLAESFVDVTGGKSITRVNKAGKASPSLEKLARVFEPPEEAPTVLPKNFSEARPHFERTSMATGEFMQQLEDALYPLLRRVKVPFRSQFDDTTEIVKGLRGQEYNAAFKEPVAQLRKLLDEFRVYANNAGMDVGHVDSFFPRVYSVKAIQADETGFMQVLVDGGVGAEAANDIAARITKDGGYLDLTKQAVPRDHAGGVLGRSTSGRLNASLESGRSLKDIPDEVLAPYLENDLYAGLVKYIESGVQRAEWVRSFGQEGAKLNDLVAKGIQETHEAGLPTPGIAIDRVYDLADALQGQYRPIAKPIMRDVNKLMTSYQLIRTLPLATLSSLSEPFVVALRGGAKPAVVGAAKALHHGVTEILRVGNKKFPKSEYTRAIEEVGMGLDGALAERLTATFGGEVNKLTATFFKLNGLHEFTKLNRVMSNEAGKSMVQGHLKALSKGAKGGSAQRYIRELKELGIDPKEGAAWVARGAKKDDPYYESIKTAGVRFTNETVMNPRATVRPMWQSNPHYHLIAQLKGFQTAFGNTVLKRIGQELARDPISSAVQAGRLATAGSLMIGTALLANDFREYIKYGSGGTPNHKNESPEKRLVRAVERTGFTGAFQFGLDAIFAHRFGRSGFSPLLGPAASQATDIGAAAGKAIDGKPAALENELINAIPGANVHKPAREALKEAIPLSQIEISELFEVAETGDTVRVMRNAKQIVDSLQDEIDAIQKAQQAMLS
jgi:hypothetical protein